ncbi:MAG: Flp family type IVb pilin [Geminicoccaceae bacterium]
MFAGQIQTIAVRRANSGAHKDVLSDAQGSVALEYGLIAALVVVVVIVALIGLRTSLIDLPLPSINTAFDEALS